ASMAKKGKATLFAHLMHLKDHNETAYLTQALNYIKSNRHNLPFEISEIHDLLNGNQKKGQKPSSVSGGCPGSTPASFSAASLRFESRQTEQKSALTQWPVQLHLINPASEYFK